jgi:hypothetical protein
MMIDLNDFDLSFSSLGDQLKHPLTMILCDFRFDYSHSSYFLGLPLG